MDLVNDRFFQFARTLEKTDVVVIEATGNSAAVERLLLPFVKTVAVANPRLVLAIAFARVKTDAVTDPTRPLALNARTQSRTV